MCGRGNTTTYTYDASNRLTGYQYYKMNIWSGYEDELTATYTYDPLGKRKTFFSDETTTNFYWDGDNIVREKGPGTTTYYRGKDSIIAQIKDGTKNYYIYDGHGDTIALLDSNGFLTVQEKTYTAFGNTIEGTLSTPFQYNGQYYDSYSGLYYLRNRYYDPSTGRFLTEDPAKDGLNWYIYCMNDPVNFVDPWGLMPRADQTVNIMGRFVTPQASLYAKKYSEEMQNLVNNNLGNLSDPEYLKAFDEINAKLDDIFAQDDRGEVSGTVLDVPVYNQLNTNVGDENNLCWATCAAMIISYQLGDQIDRTLEIAAKVASSNNIEDYNVAREWVSTATLGMGSTKGQEEHTGAIPLTAINAGIDAKTPVALLYSGVVEFGEGRRYSGHYCLAVGYAKAKGHNAVYLINDPFGGVQRLQTEQEVRILLDGRKLNSYAK